LSGIAKKGQSHPKYGTSQMAKSIGHARSPNPLQLNSNLIKPIVLNTEYNTQRIVEAP
jgi:hypothetical protein